MAPFVVIGSIPVSKHRQAYTCYEERRRLLQWVGRKSSWNLANKEKVITKKKNRGKTNKNIIADMFFPFYLLCYGFRPKCTLICFQLSCRTQPLQNKHKTYADIESNQGASLSFTLHASIPDILPPLPPTSLNHHQWGNQSKTNPAPSQILSVEHW